LLNAAPGLLAGAERVLGLASPLFSGRLIDGRFRAD
jgi:hypothetical protein